MARMMGRSFFEEEEEEIWTGFSSWTQIMNVGCMNLGGNVLPLVSWNTMRAIYTSVFSDNRPLWIEVTGMTKPIFTSKSP